MVNLPQSVVVFLLFMFLQMSPGTEKMQDLLTDLGDPVSVVAHLCSLVRVGLFGDFFPPFRSVHGYWVLERLEKKQEKIVAFQFLVCVRVSGRGVV